MSNPFRDQLKKAKLLSDKDAKRLAHEERVQRSQKSRTEAEAEEQRHKAELQAQRAAQRQRDREQQAQLEAARKAREEAAACRMLLQQAQDPGPGSATFYFETPEGDLPWIEVSAQQLTGLTAGALRIARPTRGTHVYKLLSPEHAKRVVAVFPDAVMGRT